MDSRTLIKLLEEKGWKLDRVRGSHHVFVHEDFDYPIVVPHPKKDMKTGTLHKIMKDAGLK